jgi:hypothetical protein
VKIFVEFDEFDEFVILGYFGHFWTIFHVLLSFMLHLELSSCQGFGGWVVRVMQVFLVQGAPETFFVGVFFHMPCIAMICHAASVSGLWVLDLE